MITCIYVEYIISFAGAINLNLLFYLKLRKRKNNNGFYSDWMFVGKVMLHTKGKHVLTLKVTVSECYKYALELNSSSCPFCAEQAKTGTHCQLSFLNIIPDSLSGIWKASSRPCGSPFYIIFYNLEYSSFLSGRVKPLWKVLKKCYIHHQPGVVVSFTTRSFTTHTAVILNNKIIINFLYLAPQLPKLSSYTNT